MSDRIDRANAYGYTTEALGISSPGFTLLRDLIAQRTGVFFDDARSDLLADKLSSLVTDLGMTSLLDYYYLLRYDPDADRHWTAVMDRIAVPETYFWRQPEHFDVLARVIAPRFFATHPGRTLRIWSAASCSGEEPLSIALALSEAGILDTHPVSIVASDGSPALVAKARRGLYGERAFRALPPTLRDKYFRRDASGWRVLPCLREPIRWTTANLLNAHEVAPLARADVIFCRNVFIYFTDDAIRRTVRVFAEHMPHGGYLFLGAPESLSRLDTDFRLVELGGAFVWVNESPRTADPGERRPQQAIAPAARGTYP